MSESHCLLVDVHVDDEPATYLDDVVTGLQSLVAAVGDEPKELLSVSPGGRPGRDRAFSWKTFAMLAADENVGTITAWELRSHPTDSRLRVYLRHNPKLPVDAQPPASMTLAVELREGGFSPPGLATAAAAWLSHCAMRPTVLHGGVTILDNTAQAAIEATGTSTDATKQPAQFQQRHEHDWWRNKDEIRRKCRRLYWTTLLGPALTAAAGGAEAARAAGALNVREINGSIVFQAMEGPPRDSLDPEFLAATTKLRRWLWPHTFQNPLDAAGFEAEVGLVAPT